MNNLEWLPFLEKASAIACSVPARLKITALSDPTQWAQSPLVANHRQHETREAAMILAKSDLWQSLQDLEDPAPSLERLGRQAVLDLAEWSGLRRWLRAMDSFAGAVLPAGLELIPAFTASLPDASGALRQLDRILTPEGELSENASPELARIGSELRGLKREISVRMESLARDYSQKGHLQGNYTDLRDGRFVLPVKLSSQQEVPGLHHEASASRQTVFIEPREVTELNNRLRQRQNDWLQEVHRILSQLSKDLAPQAAAWSGAIQLLIHWDAVQARARVAGTYEGLPLECGSEMLELRGTAHPLLWWTLPIEKIQRNSIELSPSQRALLITGPNTGGKTVLLKTVGLAAIFARTGFFFPTEKPGKVPFFGSVFADLGDQQSIEAHLSSFSSHLMGFKAILQSATDQSLVLLDELNSATDPEEGAALSRALLESLLDRGSWLVTTTHDPVLKSLGRTDSRILTAAMAFDESAKTPTYRLELGVPGRSRALETAERLGIPAAIIQKARSLLSTQHREWETWVGELERQVVEARLARQQAEELREEAEKKNATLAAQLRDLKTELEARARQQIRKILEGAQEGVRRRLEAMEHETSRKRIETARNELVTEAEGRLAEVEESLDQEIRKSGVNLEARKPRHAPTVPQAAALEVGMTVRVPKWKATGKILEVRPDGQLRVAMGTLQMTLAHSEIERIEGAAKKPAPVKLSWQSSLGEGEGPSSSRLDVRGMRLDEALARTERYLEQVFSSRRFAQVTVVHGLGTGALREGIRKLLESLPFVSEFRDGGPGGGGAGATTVELTEVR